MLRRYTCTIHSAAVARAATCVALVFGGASLLHAQENHASLEPYLDDAAVAVVTLDLRQDLAVWKRLFEDSAAAQPAVRAWGESLLAAYESTGQAMHEAGATRLHAVLSLHDAGEAPYFIIPTGSPAHARRLSERLKRFGDPQSIDSVLVLGGADMVERLDPGRVPRRGANLEEAMSAGSEAPFQLVCAPTEDQRRVLREMLPRLPDAWGGLTGSEIADGVLWLSFTFDPQVRRAQLTVASADEGAASRLAAALPQLLSSVVRMAADENAGQKFDAALKQSRPAVTDARVTLVLDAQGFGEWSPAVLQAATRLFTVSFEAYTARNLKQLGLAFHNFHDTYGSFPPAAAHGNDGTPLLSWRVYLLPFLEEHELYEEFRLNEAWDSPHNRQLIERMPAVFKSRHFDLNTEGKTVLQVPTGTGLVFHGQAGTPITAITDGTSNTVLALEVPREQAVPWTQPRDFAVAGDGLKSRLLGGRDETWSLLADGAAVKLSHELLEMNLRALFTHAGGEAVSP